MKKLLFIPSGMALLILLSGCPFNGPDPSWELQMYVSLGLAGSYPAEYPGNELNDLALYGGKTVVFTVEGAEAQNAGINVQKSATFGWTGGDVASSTQYAAVTLDLSENTMYLAGSYKFRMFIDWNDNGVLDGGDVVFGSYSILADKDGDEATESLPVTPSEYGTSIVYNGTDFSMTIEDPLSEDSGLPWVITAVHEGELLFYSE